jgi:replication factor A3
LSAARSLSLYGIVTNGCRLFLLLLPDDNTKVLSELIDLNVRLAEMDTSGPADFVSAETLNMSVGKRVRTVVQVQRDEGGIVVGQSTDGHQLTIKGVDVPVPVSHFMEVFGIAEGNQTIRAEICTDFGPNFGET